MCRRNLIDHPIRDTRKLISDNERQFNSGPTWDYYSRFGIQKGFSSVSQPQTNGQAEAANKIVLNGIKKSLEGAKGSWTDDLSGVLWSPRTTVKEATSHSPFNLVYGNEVVLLVEVGIPSPMMTFCEQERNEEENRINLDLLPKSWSNSLLKSICNKQRVAKQFNLKSWKPSLFMLATGWSGKLKLRGWYIWNESSGLSGMNLTKSQKWSSPEHTNFSQLQAPLRLDLGMPITWRNTIRYLLKLSQDVIHFFVTGPHLSLIL